MPSIGKEDDFLLGLGNSTAGILELSAEMLKQFGGVQGVVSKMRLARDSEDTPASVKNQIDLFVARTMTEAAQQKGKTDYQSMTREQLVTYARKMIENHQGTLPQSWFAKESEDGNVRGVDDTAGSGGSGVGGDAVVGEVQQPDDQAEDTDHPEVLRVSGGQECGTVPLVHEGEQRPALLVSADVQGPDETVRV